MTLAPYILAALGGSAVTLSVQAALEWLRSRSKSPRVELRFASSRSWTAKVWRSSVWYDAQGTPYAKDHAIGYVRLLANGRADDPLYEPEWTHIGGPPVDFSRDKQAA